MAELKEGSIITKVSGNELIATKEDVDAKIAEKVKIDVPADAKFTDTTYSEITTAEIDTGTASTRRTITGRRVKYILDKVSSMISIAIGELTKSSVGLGNVDNTSDLNKPISTATQTALNAKADKTYVDSQDALKVDKTELDASLELKADKTYVDNKVKTDVPLNAKFTDTIIDISSKLSKSNDTLETYTEKVQATTGIINLSLANVFTDTPSASRTYSITNAKSGVAHSFTLIITMGATVRTLAFPSSVKWQGGETPDMTTANKTYVLTFMTVDGGTTWLGMFGGEF